MENIEKKVPVPSIGYQLYKKYVRFCQNNLLFKHVYYLNIENLPKNGVPVMLVSNHQNCANDPLALLLGLENESHPYVIARADAFALNPAIEKFFYWLGMLPAFRIDHEGEDALANNHKTLAVTGGKMLEGNRVIMYPEGTHQQGRYLGPFKFGYTRLLFQAAEMDNFQTELFVMPTAHHYSSYFGVEQDFMVTFGTPISLKPYYELYKTKPRTAQREVNKLVREQVEAMMLDVHDVEHYDTVDFLRTTYAKRDVILPEQLKLDKAFCAKLEAAQAENPEFVADIYADADALRKGEEELKIADRCFDKKPNLALSILALIAQVILLPLWIFSLYPNGIFYKVPQWFLKTDRMFTNTLVFILPVVVLIPLFALITILTLGLTLGGWWWLIGCLWVALWLPLGKFAWYDTQWMIHTLENLRFLTCWNQTKIAELRALRERLYAKLNKIA